MPCFWPLLHWKSHNQKYPKEQWDIQVIKSFGTEAEAYAHEAELITEDTLTDKMCINLKIGGLGGSTNFLKGVKKPPKTAANIANMSKAQRGKKMPPVSEETRMKISEANKGKPHPPRSLESIEKQRQTIKAKGWSRTDVQIGKLNCAKQTPGAIKRGLASPISGFSIYTI